MSELRQQVESLVKAMVDAPEEVAVFEVSEDAATIFEVEVAPDDVGKVIGRRGATVRALRTLLDARAALDDELYELEVLD
ncbi:MAG TPA: KH domain-containing protein [Thermoanaerobaculia bacterium]|nr:KH domain-containing protein [Thermoanaerobaculia bacterium]